jgi:hypothetical protein
VKASAPLGVVGLVPPEFPDVPPDVPMVPPPDVPVVLGLVVLVVDDVDVVAMEVEQGEKVSR